MEMADTIVGCLLLGSAFILFTFMNYRILFMRLKKEEKIPSPAPFIGGLAGMFLVICLMGFEHPLFIIIPLFIDPGCVPLLIWFVICMVLDLKG